LEKIKVIVSEIDGIVTEDMVPIDELGNVPFKIYNVKDFEAVNELRKHFKFVFISSDPAVNYNLCRKKNIPFFYDRKKKNALVAIMKKYSVVPDEMLYIGNKLSDIECMQQIPLSFCTEDSPGVIKNLASYVSHVYGGAGVLCDIYEKLMPEINRRTRLDK
jgi:3-deoxy-D-manno-octulosonate 8-phosphate phosphatase KdsC-like HAD superfamily phosphatase